MILKLLAVAVALMLLLWGIGKIPLSYNLRNLTVRWKTTLMTALAFTAVIALLTVMMAFVEGMKRMTEGTGRPDNVLVLSDGATDEGISNLPIGDLSEIENLPEVARAEDRPLASREAFMVAIQSAPTPSGGRPKRRFLQLRGIEDPRLTAWIHDLELLPGGSWFSEAGVQEAPADGDTPAPMIQAVLGEGVARELGRDRTPQQLAAAKKPDRLDVGDTFTLGNRTWIVVGVLDSAGSTFNSEIWAKRSLAAAMFGKENYTTLVLRAKDAETAKRLETFLAEGYEKAALNPKVELDFYKDLSETSAQFSYAIGFLAIVMSIGGIFGVMNTMFAAVGQRVGDIGVLRLLGFNRRQILVSFLLESLLIALIGGLLGCAIGSLSDGWTASSVVGGHGGGKFIVLQLAVDAEIIATGILLSLSMGLLGGLLPALSAMRLRPLDALR
ncbi:MAG: ABC transporter permease [Planctomycetes bacterium]|nr:ABC transporter permease [Planctomycetota bacterium]MCG2685632.1 ABC transporter permease [Planctomycetales bacterium]